MPPVVKMACDFFGGNFMVVECVAYVIGWGSCMKCGGMVAAATASAIQRSSLGPGYALARKWMGSDLQNDLDKVRTDLPSVARTVIQIIIQIPMGGIGISPEAVELLDAGLVSEAGIAKFTKGAGILVHRTDIPIRQGN